MPAAAAERINAPIPERRLHHENVIEELSLDSTFPLEPEIDFRRQNHLLLPETESYLTPEQVDYYQRENLICFLCEFAGKAPYKKIAGMYTDRGELKICNMDLIKMAEKAYQIAGPGSREEGELIGLYKALGGIQKGMNRVDIVSPPKVADYTLVFSLQVGDYDPALGGRPLHEVISRRQEDMHSLDTSRAIYYNLATEAGVENQSHTFSSSRGFIANPILQRADNPHSLGRAIANIGVSPNQVAFSEAYEAAIREDLGSMIEEYLMKVNTLSHLRADSPNPAEQSWYKRGLADLQDHLETIFSSAKRIRRETREGRPSAQGNMRMADIIQLRNHDHLAYAAYMNQIKQQERAVITGGTSCPSLNSASVTGIMADFGARGFSPESFFHAFTHADNSGETNRYDRVEKNACITCPLCQNTRNNKTYYKGNKVVGYECGGCKVSTLKASQ